ncbi:hypothetical protein JG687_00008607 [Phytophthora cactorum]|uniref:Uncharacterized protein n=1 Tax=Phytophthora cactorum TaxID=29920 RepID=A0A329SWI2_9STRA|nr:hypothetical protein PC111_g8682 [Phytophthora cactorum]KAG6959711.1 hypothetical protein JG687_00008607 [Phytophthora cactorum]RAW40975.1 hypothetical protein PC110_g2811 [Phytophthora cactorum]
MPILQPHVSAKFSTPPATPKGSHQPNPLWYLTGVIHGGTVTAAGWESTVVWVAPQVSEVVSVGAPHAPVVPVDVPHVPVASDDPEHGATDNAKVPCSGSSDTVPATSTGMWITITNSPTIGNTATDMISGKTGVSTTATRAPTTDMATSSTTTTSTGKTGVSTTTTASLGTSSADTYTTSATSDESTT